MSQQPFTDEVLKAMSEDTFTVLYIAITNHPIATVLKVYNSLPKEAQRTVFNSIIAEYKRRNGTPDN